MTNKKELKSVINFMREAEGFRKLGVISPIEYYKEPSVLVTDAFMKEHFSKADVKISEVPSENFRWAMSARYNGVIFFTLMVDKDSLYSELT